MISDFNESLGTLQFLSVSNKRTCFTSCASLFKSSGLITCLECTSRSDQKVTYMFVEFE